MRVKMKSVLYTLNYILHIISITKTFQMKKFGKRNELLRKINERNVKLEEIKVSSKNFIDENETMTYDFVNIQNFKFEVKKYLK